MTALSSSPHPVVIKLGGSIITRKSEPYRLRPKVLDRLGREVALGWEQGKRPIVLLHGAGSFGHPRAKAWGLSRPPPGRANRERGAALTAYDVRRLHLHVLRSLLDAGVPARSVPPFPFLENEEGKLRSFEVRPFREILAAGGVPVSFGDVVRDTAWGSSILSGDTLAVHLANDLPSRRVLFVSDVPGVLVKGSDGRSTLLRELEGGVPPSLVPAPDRPDVTGGIRGKVEAMLAIAEGGGRAGLISGLSHGTLSRAIRGEDVHGTWAAPLHPGGNGIAHRASG
ncbi:MAG: isopentenyl phosphate kinase family protein [Euryarchaeota archaeon]|nr:isopentenyl phosphate kinase family protein [Euryarchaeota archaeon]